MAITQISDPDTIEAALARTLDAPVSVRVSRRARRASLWVSRSGLEVVIPQRFARRHIPDLITAQRDWLERSLDRARQQFGNFTDNTPPTRPTQLELRALAQTLAIRYTDAARPRAQFADDGMQLRVYCGDNQHGAVFDLLRNCVKKKAREFFATRLAHWSDYSGLPYSRITVRGQRTRWGSYSAKGSVSLNYKLLFLPLELVDHVLLHELCHARHRNHSARFWSLLESLDLACDAHRKSLRAADRFIPDWVDYRS